MKWYYIEINQIMLSGIRASVLRDAFSGMIGSMSNSPSPSPRPRKVENSVITVFTM